MKHRVQYTRLPNFLTLLNFVVYMFKTLSVHFYTFFVCLVHLPTVRKKRPSLLHGPMHSKRISWPRNHIYLSHNKRIGF